tara:strand:+ start:1522 stop:1974 length:453 start_codon:yes stop_codon:yes gene_type:complete
MISRIINILLCITIITFIALLASGYIKINFRKKWMCAEKGCEENLNGEYNNQEDCEKHCDKTENHQMSLRESIPDEKIENNAWACTNKHQCIKAESGYTSKELCEENCIKPQLYQNYYPQSMIIPSIIPSYPYKRNWNRRIHRRHHHHKK